MENTIAMRNVEQLLSRSLVALLFRQILAYGTIFIGNIFLSRWLSMELYGIFAAVLAFQQTLLIFSDVGLGPALVQRTEQPTNDEIASLFTLQFTLCSIITVIIWIVAPILVQAAQLENLSVNLVRGLALILPLSAFRSIPAMLLERELRFDVIAIAETLGLIVYQVTVVILVWHGMGVNSILWALAMKYSLDLVVILYYYPWLPKLSYNIRIILPYIWFGLNMQIVRMLAYVKDDLPVLLLLPWFGAANAGQWGWAISYIGIPIYFNRLVNRIMFPAYSRSQNDPQQLSDLMNTAIWLNFAVGLPVLLVLVMFEEFIVPTVYQASWLVAIPVVNWLSINMLGGFIVNPVFPILYGTGRSASALKVFSFWVLMTTIGIIISIAAMSLVGVAIAVSSATLITVFVLLSTVRPIANVDIAKAIFPSLLAGLSAAIAGFAGLIIHVNWIICIGLTIVAYLVVFYGISRNKIHSFVYTAIAKPQSP
jgi:O-antigen/teichoic acid export membrane protein